MRKVLVAVLVSLSLLTVGCGGSASSEQCELDKAEASVRSILTGSHDFNEADWDC